MKSFTRAISNIIKSKPYQTGRYFDKDNIMVLNELGDTFYYDKTTHDCTLRVNGISGVVPTGTEMSDEMLDNLNGQLINQKILLLNFVHEGEIHVTALAATEEWDGDANPNRMFNFAGTKPTLLLDDRYSANNEVDAVVFYCIEKNGRYFLAKRLFSENFDKEHLLFTIAKELHESPDRISFSFNTEYAGMYHIKKDDVVVTPPGPIACIPTTRNFINNPVNYNLVSMMDIRYQFYAIVEAMGQRFFVRSAEYVIPTEPVAGNVLYDNELVQMDLTAAESLYTFLTAMNISTTGFNEEYSIAQPNEPYPRILDEIWHRYDLKPVLSPDENLTLTKLDGLSTTSNIPADFSKDEQNISLYLHADPFSFKLVHATEDEIQRYNIINTKVNRCINIIDYMNNGNELNPISCAVIGLPTSPNIDDVSLISCVDAPYEYNFGIQNIATVSDLSGTIQITDTVTGLTKKYIFDNIAEFFESQTALSLIQRDFPTFGCGAGYGNNQWYIQAVMSPFDHSNTHPLKIIIQMNSPNALFTNNGSNRLAFCLSVESITGGDTGAEPPVEPEPPVISCIPTSFNVTQIQGDATKTGHVIAVASIWYEGKEYPYITTADQMAYLIPNVTSAKLRFGGGFRTGILMHYDTYNVYPEYCKALVIARNTTDNYFVAGASNDNLVLYMRTVSIWDGGGSSDRIFKSETMRAINEPSEIRLTKLSPEMTQFIKTNGGDAGVFLNGGYNVNNLVDMVNQGNDIIINACVKVESNLLPTP